MDQQTVAHDGRETAYQTHDGSTAGPAVLFVHGSGCRHDVWREQTDDEHPWTPVTVDLSGHGDSSDVDTEAGPETMAAYVDDVAAVTREVAADVVVGHSLGGAVVLTLLLDGDYDLEAAVIADSGAKLGTGSEDIGDMIGDDIEPTLDFLVSANILFADDDHEHLDPTLDIMREVGPDLLRRDLSTATSLDVTDRLAEIEIPVLGIVGDQDTLTPPGLTVYLAENLPAGDYAEVPGAAHMSMLENPDTFNDELESFLERV